MGGRPSHLELLDWLAAELHDNGGSLKKLQRLIVLSAAYRQSSAQRDDAVKLDPDNRFCWRHDSAATRRRILLRRGPRRFRRLDLTMGGPGVQYFKLSKGPQSTPTVTYTNFDWNSPGANRRRIYRFVCAAFRTRSWKPSIFPIWACYAGTRPIGVLVAGADAVQRPLRFVLQRTAGRPRDEAERPSRRRLRQAFRLALLREPTKAEQGALGAYAEKHGLAALCRVLFNSNEFLFVN